MPPEDVQPTFTGDRPGIDFDSPATAQRVGYLIEQLLHHALRAGAVPHPLAGEVLVAIRAAAAIAELSPRRQGSCPEPAGPGEWTTRDIAVRLGVCRRSVQRWAAAGALPGARRVGRDWSVPAATVAAIERKGPTWPTAA